MHDYGAGRVGYLYRINMKGDYKLVGGNAKGEAFIGAVFEGSNDLIDWTILYNVTDPVKVLLFFLHQNLDKYIIIL
jgi:hypothetical protein